jgi:hypothetical protein
VAQAENFSFSDPKKILTNLGGAHLLENSFTAVDGFVIKEYVPAKSLGTKPGTPKLVTENPAPQPTAKEESPVRTERQYHPNSFFKELLRHKVKTPTLKTPKAAIVKNNFSKKITEDFTQFIPSKTRTQKYNEKRVVFYNADCDLIGNPQTKSFLEKEFFLVPHRCAFNTGLDFMSLNGQGLLYHDVENLNSRDNFFGSLLKSYSAGLNKLIIILKLNIQGDQDNFLNF